MTLQDFRRLACIAAVALLAAGCAKHETPTESVRPVQLTQVTLGAGGDTAVFAGEIKPRHEADLGFRIGGKMVARYVDVGAKVRRGDVLARLDPADVGLQTEAAKAQLAAAETEYSFAKAEFERYQTLLEQKFISASALDAKRNTLNANRAKFEQAKAQLAVTANQASYAALAADQDGVITGINAEVGQVVTPGQVVVRLAREEEREVAIAVPENRIGELRTAKTMGVVLWANPAKVYPARVREVAPAVDPATRTFAVRVSVLAPDPAMQWGMTANVVLRGDGVGNVALLPLTALYQRDGKPAVWIFDPGTQKVSLRPVEIGPYREDGVVILAGLNEGDLVVTAGVHKLTAGQIVRPYEGAPPSEGASKPAPTAPGAPAATTPAAAPAGNSSAPMTEAALRS
jgi:multidrug efflux system membrane fusion protein